MNTKMYSWQVAIESSVSFLGTTLQWMDVSALLSAYQYTIIGYSRPSLIHRRKCNCFEYYIFHMPFVTCWKWILYRHRYWYNLLNCIVPWVLRTLQMWNLKVFNTCILIDFTNTKVSFNVQCDLITWFM